MVDAAVDAVGAITEPSAGFAEPILSSLAESAVGTLSDLAGWAVGALSDLAGWVVDALSEGSESALTITGLAE